MSARCFLTLAAAALVALWCGSGSANADRADLASEHQTYDVLVYGQTSGAIAAAIQASRMGAAVALVAPYDHVGGFLANGLSNAEVNGHAYHNSYAISGISLEFHRRIDEHYGRRTDPTSRFWRPTLEPHVAEAVFGVMLEEAGVDLFLSEVIAPEKVVKAGPHLLSMATSGHVFTADVFLDGTIEGDLLAAAGVTTTYGREGNGRYAEKNNGVRTSDHRNFDVDVDPYVRPGDPASGLIYTVLDEPLGEPGAGDDHSMAYCFRATLTNDPNLRVPFPKPEGYDREKYEIYRRYLAAGGRISLPELNMPYGRKGDYGAWHDLSHNLYGLHKDWPILSFEERRERFEELRGFTLGIWYHLANDEAVPEEVRREWSRWGLASDEFEDAGFMPRQLYVRQARRMVSDFVHTEQHTLRSEPVVEHDTVGVATWVPDVHHVRRIVVDGRVTNEGMLAFDREDWDHWGLSYRAFVPRKGEADNVLSITAPSMSHLAYAAFRLDQTFMAVGQALGAAAFLASDEGIAVQDLPYARLKEAMNRSGLVYGFGDLNKAALLIDFGYDQAYGVTQYDVTHPAGFQGSYWNTVSQDVGTVGGAFETPLKDEHGQPVRGLALMLGTEAKPGRADYFAPILRATNASRRGALDIAPPADELVTSVARDFVQPLDWHQRRKKGLAGLAIALAGLPPGRFEAYVGIAAPNGIVSDENDAVATYGGLTGTSVALLVSDAPRTKFSRAKRIAARPMGGTEYVVAPFDIKGGQVLSLFVDSEDYGGRVHSLVIVPSGEVQE